MEDFKRRCQQNDVDSVIGKLMGLGQLRPQQPIRGKQRGLSDDYVWKSASVGLRSRSFVNIRRSGRSDNDEVPEEFDNSSTGKVKMEHDIGGGKLNTHIGLIYRGDREFIRPESRKEIVVDGSVSPRHSCIACNRTMNTIFGQETRRSKFEELLRLGCMGKNYKVNDVKVVRYVNGYTNYIRNESRMRNLGRWKATGEVRKVGFYHQKGQTLDEMLALADKKAMLGNLNTKLCSSGLSRSSDSSSPSFFSSTNASEDNYLESSSASEFEAINETLPGGLDLRQDESTENNKESKEETVFKKDILEHKDRRVFYQASKSFSVEESLNEFYEEDSVSSNSMKTNHHSPDSALESFHVQNSSTFGCFDSIGLRLQLQALNHETEETYSEGSVMLISGDEDDEDLFNDLSHDGRKVKRWLRDNESKNFSYMADVLDEAGYCGMKPFIDSKEWDSLDCPISPFVFEALEKKYGKQTSWQKSERQLLFDRINSALFDIFNPIMNLDACESSIRRWICAALRRDEVENEVWSMLVRQENDKSKDLSEKAIGKWLEFEEGMDIICRDLETLLFDDLVMELASLSA